MLMEIAAFEQNHEFVEQIFAMRKDDLDRKDGDAKSPRRIWIEIQAEQRQARESDQPRNYGFAQNGKTHGKKQQKRSREMVIENQQRA